MADILSRKKGSNSKIFRMSELCRFVEFTDQMNVQLVPG